MNSTSSPIPLKLHSLQRLLQFGLVLLVLGAASPAPAQTSRADNRPAIGLLKYRGGGDWYSADRALRNLILFIRQNTNVDLAPEPAAVEPSSAQLYTYPVVFVNGHGNIAFSEHDVTGLRNFVAAGGFLFANDDYGMDASFRREMKKVLPDAEWMELPFNHPLYNVLYKFPHGLPKIHEHDGQPAQGYGLFLNGVMVAFYNYQCDLADGWEDESVHHDPADKRQAALEMGTNVILFALSRGVE